MGGVNDNNDFGSSEVTKMEVMKGNNFSGDGVDIWWVAVRLDMELDSCWKRKDLSTV